MAKIVGFKEIALSDLVISKSQVRQRETGKEIDELVDSIQKVGLLEPILVAPAQTPGKFEIILGQRRFLAHQELGKETITAGMLSERVGELEAKVLSVTENLVRRDLNRKDLIDVCTYLYKQYGSMKDVAEETGLPYHRVREFVKYDRLLPELKEWVDRNPEANLKTALRAQDAAAVTGDLNPNEAIKLAEEMSNMSGAQQEKIQKELEEDSTVSVDQAIEQAKSREKIIQFRITLGQQAHDSLRRFAKDEGTVLDDAAAQLIEEGLAIKGYKANGGIE